MKKKLAWLGSLLLIFSIILNFFFYQEIQKTKSGILVIEVLDGDTILLEGKVRLRLRGIDAPELNFCQGEEAKAYLADLVKDQKVEIKEKILDQRGRPMAYAYSGNTFVNLEMVKAGLARYHSDQGSQAQALKADYDEAKRAGKGIFSPQCYQMENLENPKCTIKGNIDKATKVRKYYLPNCAQYKFTIVEKDIGEDWFCTEKQAQAAGFTKAETCK